MEREQQGDSSLHTVAIILLCCGAVKMLHLLGVITVEGESSLVEIIWILVVVACSIYRG